ncbi:MmcQ/YjbR family DNA-binding protein [Eubacteriales bacterium OttesenSCG-928-N13]|nr:MmcQ/YjbR family DNA-binding protein [Eubacteriales bacterium OttesenSCG-928-N13]
MNYAWTDEYLLQKPGVEKDFKAEWGSWRYMIRGKMLVMQGGDKTDRPILTIKLDPALSELLRAQYEQIVPGYYSNKTHWSSLYLDGEAQVPDETVRGMLDNAHELILNGLSKKIREEILQTSK